MDGKEAQRTSWRCPHCNASYRVPHAPLPGTVCPACSEATDPVAPSRPRWRWKWARWVFVASVAAAVISWIGLLLDLAGDGEVDHVQFLAQPAIWSVALAMASGYFGFNWTQDYRRATRVSVLRPTTALARIRQSARNQEGSAWTWTAFAFGAIGMILYYLLAPIVVFVAMLIFMGIGVGVAISSGPAWPFLLPLLGLLVFLGAGFAGLVGLIVVHERPLRGAGLMFLGGMALPLMLTFMHMSWAAFENFIPWGLPGIPFLIGSVLALPAALGNRKRSNEPFPRARVHEGNTIRRVLRLPTQEPLHQYMCPRCKRVYGLRRAPGSGSLCSPCRGVAAQTTHDFP